MWKSKNEYNLEIYETAHSFLGVGLDISNLFFQLSKYYNVIFHS